jgi:energy-coupling factor transporter ATP-binding protein EcfA2
MWAAQDFDDAFQPIQDFEIRCARDHDLAAAMQSGDPRQLLALRESEYRQKVAERFGSIELRGIQVNHRVILDLEKVYVPLRAQELAPLVPGVVLAIDTKREIVEIIRERRHVVVFGDPGSGKSTLVSFLARLSAIGPNQTGWPDRILPFVITVRQIKEADLSPRWLANQSELDLAVVEAALSEQRVFLLVDGLDEAPESVRTQLVVSVARFVEDYPGVLVIVTSRPAGIAESLMVGLNGFSPSQLLDFSDDDVNEFIDKWCLAAEESARSDHAEAATQATAAASDLKARIARSGPVKRIAANPLLTTILCVVHRFLGRTIPEHRITLYEKCTDALLYEWDRAKFPKGATVGDLDANQKSVLLRRVASALHENHEAEMAEHETIRRFAAVLPQLGRPTEDASKIMHEIRDRTGVLVERRPGIFAFSHLTFQEYFTALDYAARPEQLINYVDDPWWHEVIALTAGAPGCDPRVIIRALLRRSDTESIILAAKCLETAINVPFDLRNKVEKAVERILPPRGFEDAQRLREIGLTVAPIIARNLAGYSVLDKSYSLSFFRGFDYDPVIPTLIQMADDNAATAVGGDAFVNLGEWAIIVLRNMATTSENAKRALFRVLSRSLSPDFLNLLRLDEIFGADFKLPPPEKRSSTRARNTASKLPNTPVRASR